MLRNTFSRIFIVTIFFLCVTAWAINVSDKGQAVSKGFQFQWLQPTEKSVKSRAEYIANSVKLDSWPQTGVFRLAPEINMSLLTDPGIVTKEFVSYSVTDFADITLDRYEFSWSSVKKVAEPLPDALPEDRKQKWLAHLAPEKRNDPEWVEKYLQRRLKRYRESKAYSLEGRLTVLLCETPASQAAYEYLLTHAAKSSFPAESIARRFSPSLYIEDLGTISFVQVGPPSLKRTSVMFVRDNIAVIIEGQGNLSGEAIELAHTIDALMLQQPPLTYEEFLDLY